MLTVTKPYSDPIHTAAAQPAAPTRIYPASTQTETFKRGDTVTRKGTDTHGVVVDTYTFQGTQKVKVKVSIALPPIVFDACELTHYAVQSPDMVVVQAKSGIRYMLEVMDVTADGKAVYFHWWGKMVAYPMAKVICVVPSSMVEA